MKPKDELEILKKLDEERKRSDQSYAPMLVKVIVFAFIGMVCVAFVTFLVRLVWPSN